MPEEPSERKPVKRLYKSKTNKVLCGVGGGLGDYLGLDPVIIRVLWVLFTLMWGVGIIVYIIAAIVVPENPEETEKTPKKEKKDKKSSNGHGSLVWGTLLVIVGLVLLLNNLNFIPWYFRAYWRQGWRVIWPLLIIFVGIILLLPRTKTAHITSGTTLCRSRDDRMIGGVCGGLASYLRVDPSVIRVLWALGTLVSLGLGIVAYVIMLVVIPKDQPSAQKER